LLLPIAFCLLPFAFCLLPIAFCLLPFAYCLLPIAFCLVPALGFLCGLSDRKVLPLVLLFSCGPGFLRVSESPW
jgi:hypothetical protein